MRRSDFLPIQKNIDNLSTNLYNNYIGGKHQLMHRERMRGFGPHALYERFPISNNRKER